MVRGDDPCRAAAILAGLVIIGAHAEPVTAALFGIGALSICTLPPFSGFASDWLLQGFLRGFAGRSPATAVALLAGVAALALAGGLTAAGFVKAFGIGFLGQPRTPAAAAAGEGAPSMVAGTALLAVPRVVLGVVPGAVMPVLARPADVALGGTPPGSLRAGTGLEVAGTVSAGRRAGRRGARPARTALR